MVCTRHVFIYNTQTFWFHFCATELFLSILDGYSKPEEGCNGSSFVQMLLTGNLN